MLVSYIAMQNAIMSRNMAVSRMMDNSSILLNSLNFGCGKDTYTKSLNAELSNKADETKISVLQNIIDALNKKTAQNIKNSAPKYTGVNYKA